jgi:hypothetical protein
VGERLRRQRRLDAVFQALADPTRRERLALLVRGWGGCLDGLRELVDEPI